MGIGMLMLIIDIIISPTVEFEFMDYDWPLVWVVKMVSIALIVFGFVFGALAAISARKAHIARMKADAAAAAAAASTSESPTEPSTAQPAAQSASYADSTAIFAVPEPRVMVVDEIAKPNVEFPTSAKA
jgi:hypothetical protein